MHRLDPGTGDVEAEPGRFGTHPGLLAEQDDLGYPAAQQDRSGLQNPGILGLGQHDDPLVGAGLLHDLILEHARGAQLGTRHVQRRDQHILVHPGLEQPQCLGILALRTGHRPAERMQGGRGGVGAAGHGADRDVDIQPIQQPDHRLGNLVAPDQEDGGQAREGVGGVGEQQAGQQIGAVGGDQQGALRLQPVQHIGQGHAGDHGGQRLGIQCGGIAAPQLGAQALELLANRRRGQQFAFRQSGHDASV